MAYREIADAYVEDFIEGRASLNTWSAPAPTGDRNRRSAWIPRPLYAAAQGRRTALRLLEHVRLVSKNGALQSRADVIQRALMTDRYRKVMIDDQGRRRAYPTLGLALGAPIRLGPRDTLFCAGFGWSHTNIDAIAALSSATRLRFSVLCYDLIPLLFPQFYKSRDVEDVRRYWHGAFRLADDVIVNAAAIAGDASRYCEENQIARHGAIRVVPLGSSPTGLANAAPVALPAGLTPGRYALFVSTIEPRKGHATLYQAWTELLARGVPQAHDFKLVFVGRPGWMTDELLAKLGSDDRLKGNFLHLAHVSDAELAALYRGAAFGLYPSLYEGFGLPLVEAFGFGKTLISSNAGALREVGEGFALMLDPRDEPAWRETLATWIAEPASRAPYERAIADRFSHRSWDAAAEAIFEPLV